MKSDVRAHYNRISEHYPRRKREAYLRVLRDSISGYSPRRVVDLGCGSGIALSWLGGERIGVDFSDDLLRNAYDGPDYVVADVEAAPFRDRSFDLVICLDVIEHLPSLKVVEEAHRILVDDGIFHVSTADPKYDLLIKLIEWLRLKLPEGPHTWRRPKEIIEKMTQTGFFCHEWSRPPIRFYKGIKSRASESSQH